jgi:uncharacterized protein (TIRG00374 family)
MKNLVGVVLKFGLAIAHFFFNLGRTLCRRFPVLIKYGIGVGLLGFMAWKNWDNLSKVSERTFHPGPLAVAFALTMTGIFLTFVRWYILVRAVGLPFTLTNACRLGMIGYSLSTLRPGSVGGDIIKAAFIARDQSRRTVAVATVLIDRGVGLWGLCWFVALLGGVFWLRGDLHGTTEDKLQFIILTSMAINGVGVLVWLLLGLLPDWRADRFAGRLERNIPKVGRQAAEFWRAIWMYRKEGKSFWLALALAVLGHFGFVFLFYFSALSIQDNAEAIPSVVEHLMIVPIGMIVQAVGITPGGLGIGEAAFGGLYTWMGKQFEDGFWGSFIQRAVTWVLAFVAYVVYVRTGPALSAADVTDKTEPVAA